MFLLWIDFVQNLKTILVSCGWRNFKIKYQPTNSLNISKTFEQLGNKVYEMCLSNLAILLSTTKDSATLTTTMSLMHNNFPSHLVLVFVREVNQASHANIPKTKQQLVQNVIHTLSSKLKVPYHYFQVTSCIIRNGVICIPNMHVSTIPLIEDKYKVSFDQMIKKTSPCYNI